MSKKIKKINCVDYGRLFFEPYYGENSGYGCFVYNDDDIVPSCCTNFKSSPEEALVHAAWLACEKNILGKKK